MIRDMRLTLVASLVLLIPFDPAAQEKPLPDLQPFLAEVRKRLQTDEELQSPYMFTETRRQLKLDKTGRATEESVDVFEVYPGLPGERRYRRKIQDDGKPVGAAELGRKDRDRLKRVEEWQRKQATMTEKDRAKAMRVYGRERREFDQAVDELFRIYDIRVLGRETIDGHVTIAGALTPRPDVKARTRDGRIMQKFKARAWVSESDYELVRVEIEAIDDLTFGLGLLARVHKGTIASYQRRKVNDEVWLPAAVTYTASARVMLFRRMRVGGTSEYSNYRKFTVDTSTTYAPKPPS